ncbi:MAG: RES family NAD+ phosphorylase [Trueperaceae bacterium]
MQSYFLYDDRLPWAKQKDFNPLGGVGAIYSENRWNHAGHPMLYTSQNASLAMWEVTVHTGLNGFGRRKLIEVSYEDSSLETLTSTTLVSLSRGGKHEEEKTQEYGSEWLKERRSLVLCVPSVLMPFELNLIFNPLHPEMKKVSYKELGHVTIDRRFLKRRKGK